MCQFAGIFDFCIVTAGVELNRKMLSEMAINDPKSFEALVATAKAAL